MKPDSDSDTEEYLSDDEIVCPLCLTAVPINAPTSRSAAAARSTGLHAELRASQCVGTRQASNSVATHAAPRQAAVSTAHSAAGATSQFAQLFGA